MLTPTCPRHAADTLPRGQLGIWVTTRARPHRASGPAGVLGPAARASECDSDSCQPTRSGPPYRPGSTTPACQDFTTEKKGKGNVSPRQRTSRRQAGGGSRGTLGDLPLPGTVQGFINGGGGKGEQSYHGPPAAGEQNPLTTSERASESLAGAVAPRAEARAWVGFGPGGLAVRWRSFVRVAGWRRTPPARRPRLAREGKPRARHRGQRACSLSRPARARSFVRSCCM